MAFEFETPLILKLRKALGGGLTLVASLFFLLTSALFGLYVYLFTTDLKDLPVLAVILTAACLFAFLTGLVTFVSARRCEKMLTASGAVSGIVFSLISLIALVGSYIYFYDDSHFFEPIRNMLAFFGIHDGPIRLFGSEIFFCVAILYLILALGFFASVRKTILNNRPHRAFSLMLAIFTFILVIAFAALAVYSFITSGMNDFTLSVESVYFLAVAIFTLITLFLTGLLSIKYYTSCGGNKNDF